MTAWTAFRSHFRPNADPLEPPDWADIRSALRALPVPPRTRDYRLTAPPLAVPSRFVPRPSAWRWSYALAPTLALGLVLVVFVAPLLNPAHSTPLFAPALPSGSERNLAGAPASAPFSATDAASAADNGLVAQPSASPVVPGLLLLPAPSSASPLPSAKGFSLPNPAASSAPSLSLSPSPSFRTQAGLRPRYWYWPQLP